MNKKESLVNFAVATVIGLGGIVTYRELKRRGPLLRRYLIAQIASQMTESNQDKDSEEFLYCPIKGRLKFSNFVAELVAQPGTNWTEANLNPQSPLSRREIYYTESRPADAIQLPGFFC